MFTLPFRFLTHFSWSRGQPDSKEKRVGLPSVSLTRVPWVQSSLCLFHAHPARHTLGPTAGACWASIVVFAVTSRSTLHSICCHVATSGWLHSSSLQPVGKHIASFKHLSLVWSLPQLSCFSGGSPSMVKGAAAPAAATWLQCTLPCSLLSAPEFLSP